MTQESVPFADKDFILSLHTSFVLLEEISFCLRETKRTIKSLRLNLVEHLKKKAVFDFEKVLSELTSEPHEMFYAVRQHVAVSVLRIHLN